MTTAIIIIALIGLAISVYGITVERKLKKNPAYKPACDISDKISCSRAFLSPYGALFGIPNIWLAAFYYGAMIILAALQLQTLVILCAWVSIIGVIISMVFAYILYFKIQTFCILCTSLYVVNIALVIASYFP